MTADLQHRARRGREAEELDAADGRETEGVDSAESPFRHPPWTLGLVLVAGVITLLFGVLVSPIWLLVGSPFVIALLLWLYARLFVRPGASAS